MELLIRALCRPIQYPASTALVLSLTVIAVSGLMLAAG